MKKIKEKSLISVFLSALLLNSRLNVINHNLKALGTPPSSPEKSADVDNEFQGDDGRRYILGRYINSGNQSVVYKCACINDGKEYVVKIPINDLSADDSDKQKYRSCVLRVLRESLMFAPTVTAPAASVPAKPSGANSISTQWKKFAPPPRPTKKPRSKQLPNVSRYIRPIPFSFGDNGFEDLDNDDLLPEDQESLFSVSSLKRLHPSDTLVSIVECVRAENRDNTPSDKQNHRSLRSIPKPDICCVHLNVVEPSTIRTLRNAHITGVVSIQSYRPHIESTMSTTLTSIIKTPLPQSDILKWAQEILVVLTQLNNLGLCHQDIKPDNIFIDQGHVLVGDLGLVCDFNQSACMCIGDPAYMAPEVWKHSTRDPRLCDRADVFSLGMTVLEMLTDFCAVSLPDVCTEFENLSFTYQKRNKSIADNIDKYRMRGSGDPIPDNWKSFLRFCLAPDPQDRPTAKQAQILLKDLVW